MRVRYWLQRCGLGLLAVLLVLTAYGYYATGEQPRRTRAVTIKAQFTASPGLQGKVHVRVFQAWAGQGVLRHALESVAAYDAQLGAHEKTIDYPINDGEGLIVYAWVDVDRDGVHCTPQRREEPSGLAQAASFPADVVNLQLDLAHPCKGPEYFFPR